MKDPTRNFWRALPKPRFLTQILVVQSPKADEGTDPGSLWAAKPASALPPLRDTFFSFLTSLTWLCSLELWEPFQFSNLCDLGSHLNGRYSLPTEKHEWRIPGSRKDKGFIWRRSKKEKVKHTTKPKSSLAYLSSSKWHYFNITFL